MKKLILSFLALAATIFAGATAHAQGGYSAYGAQTLVAGGTNNVAAATTNSYTGVLTLTRQREVALQISFSSTGTNTSSIVFVLDPSVDGNTYDTANNDYNVTIAANGTNVVPFVTNLTVGAIGYLRLASVENPNGASALTNVSVIYSIKR